ncbi:potassium channel subfamily K member 6-like [Grus japonensis]|uniref:Potassium channel subfamily K member 6-like n=1 Tax=Grus japonensis TaxID=30415 RepID=A0ABC9Y9M8_GRUJA
MGRGAVLLAGAYAGWLLLGALGLWGLEGTPGSPRTPRPSRNLNGSEWDFATSLLFVTTLLTTVGYGSVAPLSAAGKAFCMAYAVVGVPITMLTLTAAVHRLTGTWTYLDAVYFCVISLCTIGLGDLVPAEQPGQPLRQLYQVAVAAYLLLGLTGVLLLARTFRRLAELHGVASGILSPDGAVEEEDAGLLEGTKGGEKPTRGGHGGRGSVNG